MVVPVDVMVVTERLMLVTMDMVLRLKCRM